MFKNPCKACGGSKVCQSCNGAGCGSCGIKDVVSGVYMAGGKCPACKGTGKEN